MKTYRGFPQRLYHRVPHWVEPGALFHIRVRLDLAKPQQAFTNQCLGQAILDSVMFYEEKTRWHITLFLLMPDHLHAVLSFAREDSMSEVIRDWKLFTIEPTRLCGRKGMLIIGCGLTNAARSCQQSRIIFGRIPGRLVYVRERKIGLGLLIHSAAKVDRFVLKTMSVSEVDPLLLKKNDR